MKKANQTNNGSELASVDMMAAKDLQAAVIDTLKLRAAAVESLVRAYLAETGRLPSECEIVEITEFNRVTYRIQPRAIPEPPSVLGTPFSHHTPGQ